MKYLLPKASQIMQYGNILQYTPTQIYNTALTHIVSSLLHIGLPISTTTAGKLLKSLT